MAKLTPAEFGEKMKLAREAKKAQVALVKEPIIADSLPASTQTVQTKEVTKDPTMEAILKRIEAQDAEIKKLKQKDAVNVEVEGKEVFKWPWNYAFSLWGWIPVISWETVKLDPTKDLLFKTRDGRESNHYLELTLSDWTITKVEVTMFNRDRTKTEHMPATVIIGETWEPSYVFNTDEYGVVTILSSKFLN